MTTQQQLPFPEAPRLDPQEAPAGYFAVLKSDLRQDGNLCRQCDWRPTCNDPATDFLASGHRCMSYAVITPDGKEYQRADGCSVVFRKK